MSMEFIFIVGIVIAIIGALSIAAVMWQTESRPSVDRSAPVTPAETSTELGTTTATPPAVSPPDTSSKTTEAAVSSVESMLAQERAVAEGDESTISIESITASYAHANDDLVIPESSLRINVANVLANQIEQLYQEYVRLEEERGRLAESLLTNMLFEKIERSAGRLEIATERETLDLREKFTKVSAEYDRVQFRLGSLQHLNLRLHDPRVTQQLDELVLEVQQLARKTESLPQR